MTDSQDSQLPLSAQLEGLLLVAADPASPAELAKALDAPVRKIEAALAELEHDLAGRGLRLLHHAGRVQLTTAPSLAIKVERFLGLEARANLSRAALETLAIIAYQQPTTRPEVDAVRGVNSDTMLKSLLFKGLIHELGRAQGPGRPIMYATTPEFLQHLGLNSIADLPTLEQPAAADGHDELLKG
jgi:segregation and condensation protein B